MTRGGDGGERVHAVVFAEQRPVHAPLENTAEADVESAVRIGRSRLPAGVAAESFHRCPRAACQQPGEVAVVTVGDEQAVAGHGAHQMMELRFDRREIGKDVGVIVFEIVEDDGTRAVVDELGTLVEECGVVLVGLDDEEGAVGQARRQAEVLRDAADEKTRRESRVLEDPRQHRAGGGLAVGAGDCEHPFVAQHGVGEPLRTGGIRQATVEDGFHQRLLAACDDVADDEDVGADIGLACIPAFDELDAERAQLVRHGRVHVGVAAGDGMSGGAGDGGNAAHEGAADAENVEVHGGKW